MRVARDSLRLITGGERRIRSGPPWLSQSGCNKAEVAMATNQFQKIQVTLTVSREFHQVLENVARCCNQTVEKYALDALIGHIDCDMQVDAGSLLGFKKDREGYQPQLRALASGGAA